MDILYLLLLQSQKEEAPRPPSEKGEKGKTQILRRYWLLRMTKVTQFVILSVSEGSRFI